MRRVCGAVLFVEEPRAGARVRRAYRAARPEPLVALRGDRLGQARVADLVTRLGVWVGRLTGGRWPGRNYGKRPRYAQ
jgi:hypothetical protein